MSNSFHIERSVLCTGGCEDDVICLRVCQLSYMLLDQVILEVFPELLAIEDSTSISDQ